MKINIVLPHQLPFPPARGGGVEYLNWLLAQQFVSHGHEVVAYSRLGTGLSDREGGAPGIRHVRVKGYDRHPNRWLDHLNALRYAAAIYPVLEPADVTTFHTPFSFLLRRKPGIGVCAHTLHRTPKWPLPLYRKLDRLYCGSDAVLEQARRVDVRAAALKRIYNCIELNDDPPKAAKPDRAGEGLAFLYVGRFTPDKGIESLVKGFAMTLGDFPVNRLATVGPRTAGDGADPRFFRQMQSYVSAKKLGHAISFGDPVFDKEKLSRIIAGADVVCVPSLGGETFSMAVLEAMALAKPVLVSNFSPMPEAVDHLRTGYVAQAGNAASISEAIRFFSNHSCELRTMGLAGFAKVSQFFSVQRIAGEYLADFEQLIASRTEGRAGAVGGNAAASSARSSFRERVDAGAMQK